MATLHSKGKIKDRWQRGEEIPENKSDGSHKREV